MKPNFEFLICDSVHMGKPAVRLVIYELDWTVNGEGRGPCKSIRDIYENDDLAKLKRLVNKDLDGHVYVDFPAMWKTALANYKKEKAKDHVATIIYTNSMGGDSKSVYTYTDTFEGCLKFAKGLSVKDRNDMIEIQIKRRGAA